MLYNLIFGNSSISVISPIEFINNKIWEKSKVCEIQSHRQKYIISPDDNS